MVRVNHAVLSFAINAVDITETSHQVIMTCFCLLLLLLLQD